MPKRPCARPGCPNLVASGYCDGCSNSSPKKVAEGKRQSAHKRGYTREWTAYSRNRLKQYPLCEGLRIVPNGDVAINTHPGRVVQATLTDHIKPHKGSRDLFWDPNNHQSGCADCHNVKTAREDGGFGRDTWRGAP